MSTHHVGAGKKTCTTQLYVELSPPCVFLFPTICSGSRWRQTKPCPLFLSFLSQKRHRTGNAHGQCLSPGRICFLLHPPFWVFSRFAGIKGFDQFHTISKQGMWFPPIGSLPPIFSFSIFFSGDQAASGKVHRDQPSER